MMTPVRCSHVTVVIHNSLLERLLDHLTDIGINHLYSLFGRSLLLNEARGFRSLLFSSDLLSESVDVLTFYLPLDSEERVMKSIIKKCRLDIPGRGSIFSRYVDLNNGNIDELISSLKTESLPTLDQLSEVPLYENLTQILCTMSKGSADELGKVLLHLGVVPTITYATGTGLRDQLGLLRITVPKEKEFLSIVVGPHEASSIMDKMITWAKLDRPGRGFIWQVPVNKGVINFKTSHKSIGQAASTEQIIAAIDSLKGDFTWRQGGNVLSASKQRSYYQGTQLIMQVNEGTSHAIIKAMMKIGISGATIQPLRALSPDAGDEHLVVPQEIIRVVVTEDKAKSVLSMAIKQMDAQENSILQNTHIFSLPVIRAFNFQNPV